MERTVVVEASKARRMVERIAYQIVEDHCEEQEIVFLGIESRGKQLADQIVAVVKSMNEDFEVTTGGIKIDKDEPLAHPIELSLNTNELTGKTVVLIDDVLNSGKTLIYAAKFLLDVDVKQLKTVTLVDRIHRKYPVRADYVGLTLSTTLQNHISVEFKGDNITAYLS